VTTSVPRGLGTVSAKRHRTPAPPPSLARIHVPGAALFGGTAPKPGWIHACQELGGVDRDPRKGCKRVTLVDMAVKVKESSVVRGQSIRTAGEADRAVQNKERCRWHARAARYRLESPANSSSELASFGQQSAAVGKPGRDGKDICNVRIVPAPPGREVVGGAEWVESTSQSWACRTVREVQAGHTGGGFRLT